ncbi:MAG: hypothetical protein Tsb002_34640 [Wenzhouxiangellaceae bacterium]
MKRLLSSTWHVFLLIVLPLALCHASIEQAQTAIEQERFAEAVNLLESQLEQHDDKAVVLQSLVQAYAGNDQLKQAEETLEDLLELRDDQVDDYLLAGEIYAQRVDEVSIFRKIGYAKKIRNAFQQALELDSQSVEAHLALIGFYVNAPGIAGGGMDEAIEILDKLRAIDSAAALQGQAMIAVSEDEMPQAIRLLEQSLEQDPAQHEARLMLAIIHINQKSYQLAWPLIEKLTSPPAGDASIDDRRRWRGALYQAGKLASESGDWLEPGAAALQQYLDQGLFHRLPPPAWAYYRLGLIHQHRGDDTQARQFFELAEQANKTEDDDSLDDLLKEQRKRG